MLQTENLTLRPHVPAHLLALRESEERYQQVSGNVPTPGIRDFLLMASPRFFESLQTATEPDPWKFGFAVFHNTDGCVIGLCGFAGYPDSTGCVELGYSIVPCCQGKGYATETAQALIQFAKESGRALKVCAHTLAERNASTRVLEKCGFVKVDEIIYPEGKWVWKWERLITKHE